MVGFKVYGYIYGLFRLTKELEKEAIDSKLSQILQSFNTDELSQEMIDQEVEAVRQELYERSQAAYENKAGLIKLIPLL